MRFCSLASGSKGNVTYFEADSTRILIDAGISAKSIVEKLDQIGVRPQQLNAICITHEHIDHVRGLIKLSHDYGLPVYITPKTLPLVENCDKIRPNIRLFEGGSSFAIEDFKLTSFPISHDAADPHGFIVHHSARHVAVATDMGFVTNLVRERLREMDWIIIEANYDEQLLKDGPYPWSLKQRVMGKQGHLSNINAAAAIREVHHAGLKGISLSHLSETNNTHEIAFDTVQKRLEFWNVKDLEILVSQQHQCGQVIEI